VGKIFPPTSRSRRRSVQVIAIGKIWKSTLANDGKGVQSVGLMGRGGGEKSEKSFVVSKDDLRAILSKIKDADFFLLGAKYAAKTSDQPTLALEITLNKKTHRVEVYGYGTIKDQQEQKGVDKFLEIWRAVLTAIPAPNPNQTPELYKAGINLKKNTQGFTSPGN
jgi:hypothetical protein